MADADMQEEPFDLEVNYKTDSCADVLIQPWQRLPSKDFIFDVQHASLKPRICNPVGLRCRIQWAGQSGPPALCGREEQRAATGAGGPGGSS